MSFRKLGGVILEQCAAQLYEKIIKSLKKDEYFYQSIFLIQNS